MTLVSSPLSLLLPARGEAMGSPEGQTSYPPKGKERRLREFPETYASDHQLDQCPGANHQPRAGHFLKGPACHTDSLQGEP